MRASAPRNAPSTLLNIDRIENIDCRKSPDVGGPAAKRKEFLLTVPKRQRAHSPGKQCLCHE